MRSVRPPAILEVCTEMHAPPPSGAAATSTARSCCSCCVYFPCVVLLQLPLSCTGFCSLCSTGRPVLSVVTIASCIFGCRQALCCRSRPRCMYDQVTVRPMRNQSDFQPLTAPWGWLIDRAALAYQGSLTHGFFFCCRSRMAKENTKHGTQTQVGPPQKFVGSGAWSFALQCSCVRSRLPDHLTVQSIRPPTAWLFDGF